MANIAETSANAWQQLVGQRLHDIAGFTLNGLDELCELEFKLDSNSKRRFISWMQEDGEADDVFFYWLSIRESSHFITDTLVRFSIASTYLVTLVDTPIIGVELYGDQDDDAVYAAMLRTEGSAAAVAAVGWDEDKKRFSRFGAEKIAVFSESEIRTCVAQQGLTIVGKCN